MSVRKRTVVRLQRTMCYWGLLKHPFGVEYVRDHYTATGKRDRDPEETATEIPAVGPTDPDA